METIHFPIFPTMWKIIAQKALTKRQLQRLAIVLSREIEARAENPDEFATWFSADIVEKL